MVSLEIKNDKIKNKIQRVEGEIEKINKLIDNATNSEEINEFELEKYRLESHLDELEEEFSISEKQKAFIKKIEDIIKNPKAHKIDSIITKIKTELKNAFSEQYGSILKEMLKKLKECFN